MPYDPEMVQPMRDDLVRLGAVEMRTAAEVDAALPGAEGTVLLVINSVCGCAAANARPAVAIARGHEVQPDKIVTVFAGQDLDATEEARRHLAGYRPSSPLLALLSGGEPVFVLERHQIEGRDAADIASDLMGAYDKFCTQAA